MPEYEVTDIQHFATLGIDMSRYECKLNGKYFTMVAFYKINLFILHLPADHFGSATCMILDREEYINYDGDFSDFVSFKIEEGKSFTNTEQVLEEVTKRYDSVKEDVDIDIEQLNIFKDL